MATKKTEGRKLPGRRGRPAKTMADGRRRGRPPANGDGDRRTLVLEATLACYVRRGIAATTLRDIASEAGVTPALLHYYFDDAAGLRQAVITEKLLPVFAGLRTTLLGMADAPLREVLHAFVDQVCNSIREQPWLPPLWIREVVSEGGSLRGLLVEKGIPDLAHFMRQRFAQEQAAGRLNPELDPRLLMVSLVGLTLFPAAGTPIWRQLFASEDLDIDDIRRHALVLIERGLEIAQ